MKNVWQSKTVVLNLITLAVLVLAAPEVQALLGDQALRLAAAFQAILNLVLRVWFTNTGIKAP